MLDVAQNIFSSIERQTHPFISERPEISCLNDPQ